MTEATETTAAGTGLLRIGENFGGDSGVDGMKMFVEGDECANKESDCEACEYFQNGCAGRVPDDYPRRETIDSPPIDED